MRRNSELQSPTLHYFGIFFFVILLLAGCSTPKPEANTGEVTDIDGNVYKTVKIGNQWWMAENLKVTHYSNGDSIPNVSDGKEWSSLSSGAYSHLENDINNTSIYGLYYNWFSAVDERGVCPEG